MTVTGNTELQKTDVISLTDTGSTSLATLKVTGDTTLAVVDGQKIAANELWLDAVNNESIGQVPALELAQLTDDSYQLRFKFGTKLEIKDERPQTTK